VLFRSHRDSAIPTRSKLNILIADLVRIMNISRLCKPDERVTKVQEFIHRMQYSGYSKRERAEVYTKAKKRYDKGVSDNDIGKVPMYRNKDWERNERRSTKNLKRANWFRKDGSEAVLFVEATPDGELAESCRREFKHAGLKVKVIERSGLTIKKSLVKSNPFKKSECHTKSCRICKGGDNVICKTREVVYKATCQGKNVKGIECKNVFYEGETSRSVGERFEEHYRNIESTCEKVKKTSFLYDHIQKEHNGEVPPLKVEIVARCPGDPGLRQAIEAVRIREDKPTLNGREEWKNQPRKRPVKKKEKDDLTSNTNTLQ